MLARDRAAGQWWSVHDPPVHGSGAEDGIAAKAAFARIKSLEGEWKLGDAANHQAFDEGDLQGHLGNGSAVMQTQHPGTATTRW